MVPTGIERHDGCHNLRPELCGDLQRILAKHWRPIASHVACTGMLLNGVNAGKEDSVFYLGKHLLRIANDAKEPPGPVQLTRAFSPSPLAFKLFIGRLLTGPNTSLERRFGPMAGCLRTQSALLIGWS